MTRPPHIIQNKNRIAHTKLEEKERKPEDLVSLFNMRFNIIFSKEEYRLGITILALATRKETLPYTTSISCIVAIRYKRHFKYIT